jgi:mono/diheme cytochrome c family protein
LLALATSEDAKLSSFAEKISGVITWKFKPDAFSLDTLPAPHRASVERGELLYSQTCAACHQLDGNGLAGLAPPFEGSEWLQKPNVDLVKIALEGISGKITVKGDEWDMVMPGWAHLSDQQLADIMNYILMTWAEKPRMLKPEFIGSKR